MQQKLNKKRLYVVFGLIIGFGILMYAIIKKSLKRSVNGQNSVPNDQEPYASQDLNNPGFLINTGIEWLGEVKPNNSRFEAFIDMPHGIRAAYKNVIYHISHGGETVSKLINIWCPVGVHGNAQNQSYINYVLSKVGSDTLNVADGEQMRRLLFAIFDFEGSNKWKNASQDQKLTWWSETLKIM